MMDWEGPGWVPRHLWERLPWPLQVLGPKPTLKEGNPEEDLTADQKNAQAAALYKVGALGPGRGCKPGAHGAERRGKSRVQSGPAIWVVYPGLGVRGGWELHESSGGESCLASGPVLEKEV